MTEEEARDIAVSGLTYIAEDPEQLSRFLALTGVDPGGIRTAVREPAFLAGVLDFFLGFEPALLKFSEASEIRPERVAKARQILGGPTEPWQST
ncbi:DUF3572 domain-containing protein [Salaquimonas pukyongi]|uniref:DUF3572 domain-containing protein n=1 Tax=Salaquimonas pukyongi TaxID=2712698 RepID=UPI00096B929D|nr:DUF3572 domain-containing protein [Salaquimonas pukyongi]